MLNCRLILLFSLDIRFFLPEGMQEGSASYHLSFTGLYVGSIIILCVQAAAAFGMSALTDPNLKGAVQRKNIVMSALQVFSNIWNIAVLGRNMNVINTLPLTVRVPATIFDSTSTWYSELAPCDDPASSLSGSNMYEVIQQARGGWGMVTVGLIFYSIMLICITVAKAVFVKTVIDSKFEEDAPAAAEKKDDNFVMKKLRDPFWMKKQCGNAVAWGLGLIFAPLVMPLNAIPLNDSCYLPTDLSALEHSVTVMSSTLFATVGLMVVGGYFGRACHKGLVNGALFGCALGLTCVVISGIVLSIMRLAHEVRMAIASVSFLHSSLAGTFSAASHLVHHACEVLYDFAFGSSSSPVESDRDTTLLVMEGAAFTVAPLVVPMTGEAAGDAFREKFLQSKKEKADCHELSVITHSTEARCATTANADGETETCSTHLPHEESSDNTSRDDSEIGVARRSLSRYNAERQKREVQFTTLLDEICTSKIGFEQRLRRIEKSKGERELAEKLAQEREREAEIATVNATAPSDPNMRAMMQMLLPQHQGTSIDKRRSQRREDDERNEREFSEKKDREELAALLESRTDLVARLEQSLYFFEEVSRLTIGADAQLQTILLFSDLSMYRSTVVSQTPLGDPHIRASSDQERTEAPDDVRLPAVSTTQEQHPTLSEIFRPQDQVQEVPENQSQPQPPTLSEIFRP